MTRECPDPECVLPEHSSLVAHVSREFLRDSVLVYVGEIQRIQTILAALVGSPAVRELAYLAALQPGAAEDDVVRGMFALRQFVGAKA